MRLYRNFLNVGGMTLLSRITGFLRDILMAQVLGTGMVADAFFAAFRFPNLFRRLFAEGAFNAAFVPMFTGALEQEGQDAARALAARIISWLAMLLLVLTVLAEFFMRQVLTPFVPGFLNDPEKFELTILLTRICFPYLACMSLMAAYGAIMNGLGRYIVAAFAPVLLNLVLVSVLAVLVVWTQTQIDGAFILSIGVVVGGVAQLLLLVWAVRGQNMLPRLSWPKRDAEMARFWRLALPAILTGGVTQINIFVGTIIASGAASAISYLYYADRLYQLPLGIIGIAIGVVLLPELSRHLKGNRLDEARQVQDASLMVALLLSVPSAAALLILAEPVISTLFERGAFGAAATKATSTALLAFAVGLPAFVLIKVFQPGYFAREDTRTPTLFATISVVINIGLSVALFPTLSHVGIAIATSVSAWVNALCLSILLWRRGHFVVSAEQWRIYAMILAVSGLMAGGLWLGTMVLASGLAGSAPLLIRVACLLALVGGGLGFYFGALHFSGTMRLGELRKNFSN